MNTEVKANNNWVIYSTILLGFILLILPLSKYSLLLAQIRPEFPILIVYYWCLALPERTGLATAWATGIFQDSLTGSLIGIHALTFVLTAFIMTRFYQRIRVSSMWSQTFTVLGLILFHKLIFLWATSATNQQILGFQYWGAAITSAIFWPLIFFGLRNIRKQLGVR
ncbi:MAG: rod shape-determining protein MreD [Gammaproteobacteria bacterium]|nr:MAG: rod shape-determining protein MreD [Gammaproteobacteria bacterium]